MDLQELSKANLVLFRPLHFCAAAFGLYRWQILGCVANLALSGCGVPAWHTVYSSGKYEVSHGLSSLLGFGEMRCVACLWGMVPRGSSYFSSEHTVYSPASQIYECETWLLQLLPHLKLPLCCTDCSLSIISDIARMASLWLSTRLKAETCFYA